MKIALYNLTTTTRWGGVEMFVWEVAEQMRARGHEVVIFGGRGVVRFRESPKLVLERSEGSKVQSLPSNEVKGPNPQLPPILSLML